MVIRYDAGEDYEFTSELLFTYFFWSKRTIIIIIIIIIIIFEISIWKLYIIRVERRDRIGEDGGRFRGSFS